MKRQRVTEGAILEIKIEDSYYVYVQILSKGRGYAFFDYRSKQHLADLEVLFTKDVLFIVAVYDDVVTKGQWIKMGKLPIRKDLLVLPMKFMQDHMSLDKFSLYDPNTGEIVNASKDQCVGLERASVWAANHVEDRIRDYYLGVPNIWVEQFKIK